MRLDNGQRAFIAVGVFLLLVWWIGGWLQYVVSFFGVFVATAVATATFLSSKRKCEPCSVSTPNMAVDSLR
jgi:hypothetical protein